MADAAQEPAQLAPQAQDAPRELKFRTSTPDWALRGAIFVVFLFFATAKLKTDDPGAPWVVLFQQIGLGQWFREFTGAVEIIGALLVLVSGKVEAGLVILSITMFGAIVATLLVLHQPSAVLYPFAFLCGMIAFWLHRRRV